MARPSKYSDELAADICSRIAQGEALRKISAADDMPAMSTICLWAAEDRGGFSERYTRALEARGWLWAEEIVGIADGVDGEPDTQRDRLRVDTRKWLLSKLMPQKYGEKSQIEHTGKDGGPIAYADMTERELDRRLQELLGQVNGGEKTGESE